ncbi:MAG: hypothetical protein HW405_311 [Candidatus Berkelbacteria bacterium]|nr:hypothetical protein [Candidatus Berkelbacteria bacterium]
MAQEKKKGMSTGLKVGFGCCGGLILFFIIIGIVAGLKTTPSNQKTSQTTPPKTETKTEEPKPTIDLSFKAIDAVFGIQSDVTDLQKKEQWSQYKGQKITWTCSVTSVSETFLGM